MELLSRTIQGICKEELMEKRSSPPSTFFLAETRTISCSRLMNGFDKVNEKMDTVVLQKTFLHRVLLMEMMNEIPISSQGPKGGKARILQDAERNAAYFGKFKPRYFIVQVLKRLGTLKSVQVTTKKMGWTGEASYGCVSCTEASNPERMYEFPESRIEKKRWKHACSMKMMLDLISWANDFCGGFGICDYLGKINEINLESRQHAASVVLTPRVSETVTLSRLYAADKFLKLCSDGGGKPLSKSITFWEYLACRQRRIDGRGKPPAMSESTIKKGSFRKSQRNDRWWTHSTVLNCRLRRNPEDRWIPSDRPARNSAGIQQTLRRSGQADQCWWWTVTSKNQSRKQDWADQRNKDSQKEGSGHCCECAKLEQPWDVDLGKWVKGSGEPAAQGVTLIAKSHFEQEHLPTQRSNLSVVPCSRDVPGKTQSGVSKRTAWFTRHVGKTWQWWSIILVRLHRDTAKLQPQDDQRTDTVSDSWKAYQSIKERKRWSLLERRIKDDRSEIKPEDSYQFSTIRSHVHQSSTRSVRQESRYIVVFSQKDWQRIRIVAVSC